MWEEADPVGVDSGWGVAVDSDLAVNRCRPGERADERRFACPVGADQPENLAVGHREVDPVEGDRLAVAFADAGGDNSLVHSRTQGGFGLRIPFRRADAIESPARDDKP